MKENPGFFLIKKKGGGIKQKHGKKRGSDGIDVKSFQESTLT